MAPGIAQASGTRWTRWRALALIVGWLALAVASFAHAACAAPSAPASLGGEVGVSAGLDSGVPADGEDDCETLPDSAAPPEPAGFSPSAGHESAQPLPAPAPQRLAARADRELRRPPPLLLFLSDGRRLYLLTSRLLN